MPVLEAKLFRDYFGGTWIGRISKNGEFQREVVFNWPEAFGKFSCFGTREGLVVPPGLCVQDNTLQIAISGWRSDTRRWCTQWYNEFGGYGELQWISQDKVNGILILHGSLHECKQETDDTTDHIAVCEIYDQDHFKYKFSSFRKGLVEVETRRIRTAEELNALLEKQADSVANFVELG